MSTMHLICNIDVLVIIVVRSIFLKRHSRVTGIFSLTKIPESWLPLPRWYVVCAFKNSSMIHKERTKEINVKWVSLYLIKTRLNFTSNVLDQNIPKSKNISARMSWSVLQILKPFNKLAVVYYQVWKLSASPRVFKPDNTLLLVFLNST